jgi:hypothetical protein
MHPKKKLTYRLTCELIYCLKYTAEVRLAFEKFHQNAIGRPTMPDSVDGYDGCQHEFEVSDVQVGKLDANKANILKVYAKVCSKYAIYRTTDGVAVQFADDHGEASAQRKTLLALASLRAQINGLIDGWRQQKDLSSPANDTTPPDRFANLKKILLKSVTRPNNYYGDVSSYDATIAYAFQTALDGNTIEAKYILLQQKMQIENERAASGRLQYLIWTYFFLTIALIIFGIIWYFSPDRAPSSDLPLAAIGGGIGALFSISLGIKSRTVALDLYPTDNLADGLLRLVIGIISAGVLLLLLASNILPEIKIGIASLTGAAMTWQAVLVVGFVAGFIEKFVPELLEKRGLQQSPEQVGTPNS